MTKILYIANIRLPTEKAHGVQIMEMCAAFTEQGSEVELCVPKRMNKLDGDPFIYYALPKRFVIKRLPTWDLVHFGRVGFLIQTLTFSLAALCYTFKSNAVVYCRDEITIFLLSFFIKRFVWEIHAAKWNFVTKRVARQALLLIPISRGLRDYYVEKGIDQSRTIVSPDGVNISRFTIKETRPECRAKLSLPQDKKIVLYSGHLYERKGAHVLAEAAKNIPSDTLVVFVGGTEKDICEFQKKHSMNKNILILGHRSHGDIPYYLRAADVLVLPNSAKSDDARLYTSPMKLFEYMTSGTPIATADVPSLREILHDESALFVTPDVPEALARGIVELLSNVSLSRDLARRAIEDVSQYSWKRRASSILPHLRGQ
jgi:glycosyltransferase involved in cell wall biosynthesis